MKLTAQEILPDAMFKSYADTGLNLYGARDMLEKFFRIFERQGELDWHCLLDILQMDLTQAGELLKDDSSAGDDRTAPNPAAGDGTGQILGALQMMLHAYLSEKIVAVT